MEQTAFYVIGIALVVAALVVSAFGLREEGFPSKAALRGGLALFVVLVVGTSAAAVVSARDEQEHREEELAAEEATEEAAGEEGEEAEATGGEGPAGASAEKTEQAAGGGGGPPVKVSAVASGELAFRQKSLDANAGTVSFEFDNPAATAHDFVIETQDGEEVTRTEVITESSDTTEADLESGEYVFYCSVPGHREAGMEGTVTVK